MPIPSNPGFNPLPACLALIVALAAPAAQASLFQIEFSGTLRRADTSQASSAVDSQLQATIDGRSVRVRLGIETGTADANPAAGTAEYRGAVRSAELLISGGALPMFLQGGQPYCADAPLLDCSIHVVDNDPLGSGFQLDSLAMRSPSFDLLAGAALGGQLPVMSVFFAQSLAGSPPALVQGTDLAAALATLQSQADGWRIRLLGAGGCFNDCYAASWAIDDLVFGPSVVPAPATPLLAAAGLALMGWGRARRRASRR